MATPDATLIGKLCTADAEAAAVIVYHVAGKLPRIVQFKCQCLLNLHTC